MQNRMHVVIRVGVVLINYVLQYILFYIFTWGETQHSSLDESKYKKKKK